VIDLDFQQLKREVAQIFRSVQAACDRAATSSKPTSVNAA
jgi:hypothetical protein